MSAYAVENRRRRWFTGEEHTNFRRNYNKENRQQKIYLNAGFQNLISYRQLIYRKICVRSLLKAKRNNKYNR